MKIAYYLPEKVLTNSELEQMFPEWSAAKIEDKVGIRERHIAADGQTALDLAREASEKVLEGENREEVDFIILCTQSPDYFLPTSACILQDQLSLKTGTGAIDVNLGCSAFIYGLAMAKGFLTTGIASKVLLVTSETYSKHIHPRDRANKSIFGDGAAAVLIDRSDAANLLEFELGTDGSGMGNLIVRTGGFRHVTASGVESFTDDSGNFCSPDHLYMNGPEIFNFTIEKVPAIVDKVLAKNNLSLEQVDYVIFHQANKYMLDYLRKKIKIPAEKFFNNILLSGNTVSATIPIALYNAQKENLIKRGDKILLVGFGVGLSWGGAVIIW